MGKTPVLKAGAGKTNANSETRSVSVTVKLTPSEERLLRNNAGQTPLSEHIRKTALAAHVEESGHGRLASEIESIREAFLKTSEDTKERERVRDAEIYKGMESIIKEVGQAKTASLLVADICKMIYFFLVPQKAPGTGTPP